MTATLRRPNVILEACGLRQPFDKGLFVSPMRSNLQFSLIMLQGKSRTESHVNIMTSIIELIRLHAGHERACVFVMYVNQVDIVAATLQETFQSAWLFFNLFQEQTNSDTCSDRDIVMFDANRRPDVQNLGATDIVVATAALQTGKTRVL